jgi:hypothetical protein
MHCNIFFTKLVLQRSMSQEMHISCRMIKTWFIEKLFHMFINQKVSLTSSLSSFALWFLGSLRNS